MIKNKERNQVFAEKLTEADIPFIQLKNWKTEEFFQLLNVIQPSETIFRRLHTKFKEKRLKKYLQEIFFAI